MTEPAKIILPSDTVNNTEIEVRRPNDLAAESVGRAKSSYVWHLLDASDGVGTRGAKGAYYEHARADLIDLFPSAPHILLDVGCAGGAAAAEMKRRFPSARVFGIEMNAQAAALARTRLDGVACGDCMALNLNDEFGIERGTLDAVLLADVLEHMYDPWSFLVRLRPELSQDAVIVASIPNARNLWLLSELAAGNFRYATEGLLDITHIRFFTLREMQRMFTETGYKVTRIERFDDGRLGAIPSDAHGPIDLDLADLSIKNVSPQDAREFKTLQFYVVASPV